ncbi:MAG: hypothetical protein JNN28_14330 [Saprospiraceae bacterium]|nr:hypothetical protein [Saprospiraceae bacterium]
MWNADDAGDADFFGTLMTLVTRIFFWNADDAGDADFFWNADDADDADFFGTLMTLMARIFLLPSAVFFSK